MTFEDDPDNIVFIVHGVDPEDIAHAWTIGEGEPGSYDHEAAKAASLVFEMLKEEFEWGEDVTGVEMGVE